MSEWISVKDRLPPAEKEVLVLYEANGFRGVTTGMYEDGSVDVEESEWVWYDMDGFRFDPETDLIYVNEGWYECKHFNADDEHNHMIDCKVTHWMPLPEPPKDAADTDAPTTQDATDTNVGRTEGDA